MPWGRVPINLGGLGLGVGHTEASRRLTWGLAACYRARMARRAVVGVLCAMGLACGSEVSKEELSDLRDRVSRLEERVGSPKRESAEVVPGATVEMKSFVLNVIDDKEASHPMKISIAVELAKEAKAEEFEVFKPRIRDSVLSYLRIVSYEEANNPKRKERMQQDMLGCVHRAGATNAKSVLIQDIVIQ